MILLHLANSFAAIPNASGNSNGIRIPQLKAGLYSTTLLNYEMFVLQLLFNNPPLQKKPLQQRTPQLQGWQFAMGVTKGTAFWTKTGKFC